MNGLVLLVASVVIIVDAVVWLLVARWRRPWPSDQLERNLRIIEANVAVICLNVAATGALVMVSILFS